MHLNLCNCDHFPNLIRDGGAHSRFLAATGAVPSTVRVVGRSKKEDHLRPGQSRRWTRDPGLSERMPLGQQCERY
jgi:hypothetical protein